MVLPLILAGIAAAPAIGKAIGSAIGGAKERKALEANLRRYRRQARGASAATIAQEAAPEARAAAAQYDETMAGIKRGSQGADTAQAGANIAKEAAAGETRQAGTSAGFAGAQERSQTKALVADQLAAETSAAIAARKAKTAQDLTLGIAEGAAAGVGTYLSAMPEKDPLGDVFSEEAATAAGMSSAKMSYDELAALLAEMRAQNAAVAAPTGGLGVSPGY